MVLEPWLLIFIPIVFILGWIASRFDVRQMLSEHKQLPESYFRGLNFLLDEDHDRAIAAFVEVARLDPETTELHFALGSLFRRRGEIERAIRVHQSLLSRDDLPQKDREHALHEIAQDYLKAGMYDRAEEVFKYVQSCPNYQLSATRSLVSIYEVVHDWPLAIDMVKQLYKISKEPVPQLVHYYCEMAQVHLKQTEQAQAYLQEAEQAYHVSNSVAARARLNILSAQLTVQQPLKARVYFDRLFQDAPEYVGLVAADILKNYESTDELDQGIARLREHYFQYPSVDIFVALFLAYRQIDVLKAHAFAREAIAFQPSLLALIKALSIEKDHLDQDWALLYRIIQKYATTLDRYHCQHCGFNAKSFYWQCPGCHQWESYSPIKKEGQSG